MTSTHLSSVNDAYLGGSLTIRITAIRESVFHFPFLLPDPRRVGPSSKATGGDNENRLPALLTYLFANTVYRILAIPSNSNSFQLVPATELTIVLFSAEQSRVSFFLRVLSTKYHVHNPFQLNAIRPTTRIRLNEHRIDVIYREILDKTLCIYIYVCAYVCDSWL